MKIEFTQLEKDVLDWMANHLPVQNLAEQIRMAVPMKRQSTGVGSFTVLSVPANIPSVMAKSPINGPVIESEEIEHGGGAILFLNESGQIETLEMYANGDSFSEVITKYELTAWEESNK